MNLYSMSATSSCKFGC